MSEVTLVNIIKTWLDSKPQYREHFNIAFNEMLNTRLDWIACKCRPNGEIPPTPLYDILIFSDHINVWDRPTRNESWIYASSPSFFDKLSYYLDNCHESH